ncbi:protein translocase subunit SecD [Methyloraptor flagellatus]|jgi:protein-export membrane protein SecD|uniref:Protein translocase subunit SecD n=1 Tax=Methyloraptor flagellatus TaxID=3162530 RepID=A0AAU7XE32_9HYPH
MLYFSRWKLIAITLTCLAGLVLAVPNFLSKDTLKSLPSWMPQRTMTLGLDLQGGAHLLLEVDTASLVKDRLDVLRDDIRRVLREAKIGYTGLGISGNGVQVRVTDAAQADNAATKLRELAQPVTDSVFTGTRIVDVEVQQQDGGLFRLQLTDAGLEYRARRAVEQSIEVIRRRVDQLGTTEPLIARQGSNRLLVQVPGLQDIGRLKSILAQTARLTFHMVEGVGPQAAQSARAGDTDVLYTRDNPPVPVVVQRRAMLTGEELVDAQAGFAPNTNEPIVSFRFNTSGAQKFATITEQNVGRPFAIVLDKDVLSYPVIRDAIRGGSGQISGSFTVQSANDLALLMRAGALPANLTIVEERTVGPGLGSDSIRAGALAAVIGTAGVALYMVLNYGLLGMFANVAVVINVMFTLAILSSFGATLTLPGIAGIVLGVGMAVDANVLIYERIREEQLAGASAISAIQTGYQRAIATITDTNLTHVIAAAVLFFFGTGPIKGFALTLIIGTMTSFFTAVTVTRMIIALWYRYVRPTRVPL